MQLPKGQTTFYKTLHKKIKDRAPRTPKSGGELRCSGKVSSSCSTCVTRLVTRVPVKCETKSKRNEMHRNETKFTETKRNRNETK